MQQKQTFSAQTLALSVAAAELGAPSSGQGRPAPSAPSC